MVDQVQYSPVMMITGAGCSVPYGYPDMMEFARNFHKKLASDGTEAASLDMVTRILYGANQSSENSELKIDLEGLLTALTSLSSFPDSDNPAVSYLMDLGQQGTRTLGSELSELINETATLTDLIPPKQAVLDVATPIILSNQLSVTPDPYSFTLRGSSESLTAEATSVRETASHARRALQYWGESMENLQAQAEDLLNRTKNTISTIYANCDTEQRDKILDLFNPLFQCLVRKCDNFVDIFTLNYDLSIELFGILKQIPVNRGFESEGAAPKWTNNFDVPENTGIRLFKLHGSVNWYQDDGGVIELSHGFGPQNVSTMQGTSAENKLIYPVFAKPSWSEPYLSLFGHLSEALQRTKCVVVVGFSYRDEPIVSALHRALATNGNLRIVHCGMTEQQARKYEYLDGLIDYMDFMDNRYGQEGFITELDQKIQIALASTGRPKRRRRRRRRKRSTAG